MSKVSMAAVLEIYTLGGVRIFWKSEPVVGLTTRKTEALLIYLASTRRPQPREVLADLFWAEHSQDQALGNLRKALSNLHQVLGNCLMISRADVTINPEAHVWLDCAALEDGLHSIYEQGRLSNNTARQAADLLALYQGEFLEGFTVYDCLEFEQWAAREREHLHRLVVDSLAELVAFDIEQGSCQPGMAHAHRLLALDPLNEGAHRQMMRLLARNGQRSAAVAQYETCKKLLQEELAISPDAETQGLYEQIRAGDLGEGKAPEETREPSPALKPSLKEEEPPAPGRVPFKGLQYFDEGDADLFFGRNQMTSRLDENISQPMDDQRTRHNFPRQLTSFIGREKEIGQLVQMVREHPLVTITGEGGVGKTRLALHAARDMVGDFPDGVWLVELAPVIDPVFVPIAVASIFKVHSATGQRLVQTLREYFASKRMLLILDNCEHVIDSVAELSTSLLEGCPNLTILATSREILNVEGEFFFRCPSLSLPDFSPEHASNVLLKRVEASEAVRLFVDRAAAASPGFHLSEKNAATITAICQHLDGIPLAIELAAARLRLISLDQIADSMGNLFGLLTGSRRSVQPRHKTLKALIDWSYQLLSPTEQNLLSRLSIFAGGWTLAAAEAVYDESRNNPDEVLDWMGQLVDKSLISIETEEVGENRYHILETIRQYANERLRESGEYQLARDRHLAFFSELAQQANPPDSHHFMSPVWAHRLMKELDNIRLALEWSLETNIELGLRLGISFTGAIPFNLSLELGMWLEKLLAAELAERARLGNARGDAQLNLLRGKALLCVGEYNMLWGLRSQSERALLESRTLFEAIGESGEFWMAISSMHLGTSIICSDPDQSRIYLETSRVTFLKMDEKTYLSEVDRILVALNCYTGHLDQARQFAEEGLQISQKIKSSNIMNALDYAGNAEFLMGNYDRAVEYYQRSRESAFQFEDLSIAAWEMLMEGYVELAQGNDERVLRLSEEMMAWGRETGSSSMFFDADTLLALLEWTQGKYDQAVQRSEEGLSKYHAEFVSYTVGFVYVLGRVALTRSDLSRAEQYFRQVDDMAEGPRWMWRAYSLYAFALLAAAQSIQRPDMAERAALLFSAQEKLFAWLQNVLSPFERDEYAKALTRVKETLGNEAFSTAWARGQAMSHHQAFALVF